ncbi:MAG: hypothetical protein ACI9YT_001844, partial [Halobacteriales archaeon]
MTRRATLLAAAFVVVGLAGTLLAWLLVPSVTAGRIASYLGSALRLTV